LSAERSTLGELTCWGKGSLRHCHDLVTWLTAGLIVSLSLEARVIDVFGRAGNAEGVHANRCWRLTGARRPEFAESDLLERTKGLGR
jgi:hypothetical protein